MVPLLQYAILNPSVVLQDNSIGFLSNALLAELLTIFELFTSATTDYIWGLVGCCEEP